MADSEDELPPERDVKDFSFKQMRKIRMFEAPQSIPTLRSSLLAASSKYGLTFVGCPTGLKVVKTETIEEIHKSDEGSMQNVVAHCPSSFVATGHFVQFVGLSADDLTLSVCFKDGNNFLMVLFDVPTLGSTNTSNAKFGEVTLCLDAGIGVLNLAWNPGFPGLFAVCLSSGSVSIMEMTETEVKTLATLPGNIKASAICWSPKGKQLVVGHKDGRLTQYSQALEVKKEIDCPELFTDDPHLVTDVLWISTTLFAAVYSSFEDGDCPKFLLISTPKNEPVTITNFDDIYYAMTDDREPVFYLRNVSEWSLVVSAFSNGLEAAVVGKYGEEATPLWEKWNFEEDGRPSMPLTNNNDESFPMGLAVDFSSNKPFMKGEEQLLPAPIMMILSTDGVLCPFYMVNQTPNTNHHIVKPPEPLPLGGQRKAIVAQIGGSVSQKTGGAGPTPKGPLQPGPVSQGTPVSLPVGVFSLGSAKGSSVTLPGMPGHTPVGTLSIGTSKQPLGTPSSSTLSAFSLASPKQNVLSSLTGGTPISAFPLTSQRGEFTAFKPSSQSQSPPATQSAKPSVTPQLVKPMPTSQTQLSLAGSPVVPAPEFPASAVKPTPQPQGFGVEGEQTPSVSATTGFQLPGQSVKTETKKEDSKKEPSALKSSVIEASVSQHIQEAISHFTEEMAALRESVKKMQSNCRLTDNTDLQTLKKTTDDLGKLLAKIRDTTKDQHRDIDEDKRKLLEAFEVLEDARIRQEKKNDPRYVQLLKSRALDPVNTKKMSDIRNLHLYLDETLREVNMALDEQWNKENEQKRSIQCPALDEIFKTLKINHKIAQDQGTKLEKITEEMKNRKLLSTSWHSSSVNTSSARDESTRNPFAVYKEELRSTPQRPSAPISPEKQAQLRSMLQKRRNTPVRRSMIVPSTAAKTPTVKPSKPRAPLLSSTPTVYPSAAVEDRKGRSIISLPPTEQQELEADDNESVSEESSPTDDDEVRGHEQELKQLSKVSTTIPSSSAAASGLSFGGVTFPSHSNAAGKNAFPLAVEKEENDVKKPAAQPLRLEADDSSQGKPSPQLSTTGAFSAVGKPAESQGALSTTPVEAPKSTGFILPGAKEQAPSAAVTASKSGLPSGIRVISSETPPNIAAAMAAMSRASAAQNVVQPPSNSNLDPSASIEPATLVAYKPQAQGDAEVKGHDAGNTAAKAIANAALMAATAEAQNPYTKPQCSTEFIFKSAESGKPGPPVVTFKPPKTSPQTSVAPNVTVNPMPVFKPAFAPPTQSSSSASSTGGLRPPLSGTRTASPFSQLPATSVPLSFAPPAGVLFNLGSSSGTTFSAPNQLSFIGTAGDVKAAGQITAVSSAAAFSPASITPSQRVNRNLFASGDGSSQATSTGQQQDKSRESVLTVATSSPAITSSGGIAVPATIAPAFPFSSPTSGSEGFFKNLDSLGNTSSAFGSGNTASGSTSIMSALMQSSGAGGTGSVFGTAHTAVSTNAAPASSSPPSLSTGTPSENKDMSAASTSASIGISLGDGGVVVQALSESSKSVMAAHGSAGRKLPQTTSIFGSAAPAVPSTSDGFFNPPGVTAAPATTVASTGGLFGLPSGSVNTSVTAAPATTVASTGGLFGLPSGSVNTSVTAAPATTVASTGGLFGLPSGSVNTSLAAAPATTVAFTGGLFGLPSGSVNTSVTAAPATTVAFTGSLFGQPSGGASTTVTAAPATTVASTGSLFDLPSGGANTTVTAAPATTVSSTGSLFDLPSGGANTTVTAVPATTVASTGSLFGLPSGVANTTVTAPSATTVASTGSLFGLPSSGANTSAPPATTAASSLPGLPTGSPSSAFSVTSSASPFFACINPASTKSSAPTASSPFTSISAPPSTAATSTAAVSLSTPVSSGLFGKPTSPVSAFGTVSSAGSTPTFGSLGSATSTSTGTSLFAASAPTSVFQTPTSGVGFGSPQPFSSSTSSQGSTFGSAPVFGSVSTAAGTASVFGAKTSFGQSSFAQTNSSGFGVTASKPAENALGFGFGGFGLGGQGTSQTNKTNPFGVTQGFSASVTTQPSLFRGKSGDDIFKSSLSSGQFSQPGFGSQSSGGSFSSQGGSVLSSGFGFDAASSPGTSLGFGSSQPFGSPSAGASVFGGSPTFGSSPAFGGAPAFGGSPQGGQGANPSGGVFGSGSTGVFGQSSGSPTFGALASHSNVSSFGALAGQSPTQGFGSIQPQQQQTSSFGSFGGGSQSPSVGSFLQWR